MDANEQLNGNEQPDINDLSDIEQREYDEKDYDAEDDELIEQLTAQISHLATNQDKLTNLTSTTIQDNLTSTTIQDNLTSTTIRANQPVIKKPPPTIFDMDVVKLLTSKQAVVLQRDLACHGFDRSILLNKVYANFIEPVDDKNKILFIKKDFVHYTEAEIKEMRKSQSYQDNIKAKQHIDALNKVRRIRKSTIITNPHILFGSVNDILELTVQTLPLSKKVFKILENIYENPEELHLYFRPMLPSKQHELPNIQVTKFSLHRNTLLEVMCKYDICANHKRTDHFSKATKQMLKYRMSWNHFLSTTSKQVSSMFLLGNCTVGKNSNRPELFQTDKYGRLITTDRTILFTTKASVWTHGVQFLYFIDRATRLIHRLPFYKFKRYFDDYDLFNMSIMQAVYHSYKLIYDTQTKITLGNIYFIQRLDAIAKYTKRNIPLYNFIKSEIYDREIWQIIFEMLFGKRCTLLV